MTVTFPIIRCPTCGLSFLQVKFLPYRAAGFCSPKCQDGAGK